MRWFSAITLCVAMMAVCGCARFRQDKPLDYRTVETTANTDASKAERLYRKSLGFIDAKGYEFAEQCLQKALLADVSYGPAHNALGKVYFDQKKYYLAAWEFEHAAQTMPSRAEPLNNLGLVYESVGQLDGAIAKYAEASGINPDSGEYLGNWLRARIRNGETAGMMRPDLERLIVLDHRQEWVDWARKLLAFDRTGNGEFGMPVDGEIITGPVVQTEVFESPIYRGSELEPNSSISDGEETLSVGELESLDVDSLPLESSPQR